MAIGYILIITLTLAVCPIVRGYVRLPSVSTGLIGESVAMSGDGKTALTGSPRFVPQSGAGGAVEIYTLNGTRWTWTSEAFRLTSSNYGWSLTLGYTGQYMIIGSKTSVVPPQNEGSVHIFLNRTVWDFFETGLGVSVAMCGSYVIAGASTGLTYIYGHSAANGWFLRQTLGYGGLLVAVSSDCSVLLTSNGTLVYVDRLNATNYRTSQIIRIEELSGFPATSIDVTNNGSRIIVASGGSIYVYNLGTRYTLSSTIMNSEASLYSAVISARGGGRIAAGAPTDTSILTPEPPGGQSGQVYIYDLEQGAWDVRRIITAPTSGDSTFGYSVDMDAVGHTLIIGSPGVDSTGAAYIYNL